MAKCSSLILLIWDVCSRYRAIAGLDLPSSAILSSLHLSTQNLQPISDYQQYHYIRQSQSHSHLTQYPNTLLIHPAPILSFLTAGSQHFYILCSQLSF